MALIQILVSVVSVWTVCHGEDTLPRIPPRCFTQPGDILLGMIKGSTYTCFYGGIGEERDMVENVEAFKYIIDQTNQDNTVLPNITLGFVVLDLCGHNLGAVSAGIHFIPSHDMVSGWDVPSNCSYNVPHFDVAAVLGPSSSHDSIMLSPLLSAVEIPVFSTLATSDELSSSVHSYFVRMSPSNKHQSEAILDILTHFNWTYFALLYSDDNYGRNGAKYIEQGTLERGLCIGVSEMIYGHYDHDDLENVFNKLVEDGKIRAVVIFGYGDILTSVKKSLYGRFVWIGSDGLSYGGYGLVEDGALYISFPDGGDEDFDRYMSTRTAYETQNIYFRDYIENQYDCTWDEQSCNNNECPRFCHEFENETLGDVDPVRYKTLDTTRTMVLGLHKLISTKCSGAFQNVSLLDGCLNGPDYLSAILNVSFNGTSGLVSFNDEGEMFGQYGIKQYSAERDSGSQVGTWSLSSRSLEIIPELINWAPFKYFDDSPDQVPKSVCSTPCPVKHYYIQRELPCCWECFQCRDNEIIVDNKTSCMQCPENTWPDEEQALTCERIPATYLLWGHPISVALVTLTCVLLALTIVVCGALIHGRNIKVVKASSRELMAIILVGVLLELVTVFAVLGRPTALTCIMARSGFFISVSLVYAPLLMKTQRVYRIFKAGMKGQQARFVSKRLMTACSGSLIAIQVCKIKQPVHIGSTCLHVPNVPVGTSGCAESVFCIRMGARACDRHIPNVPTQTYQHIRDKMAVVAVSLVTIPDSLATLLVVNS